MLYEIALLPVHQECITRFKGVFTQVEPLLKRAAGYAAHMLAQGIETPQPLHLIVRWRSLDDHKNFEASEEHLVFIAALEEYFSAEPTVYHIEGVAFTSAEPNEPNSIFAKALPAP